VWFQSILRSPVLVWWSKPNWIASGAGLSYRCFVFSSRSSVAVKEESQIELRDNGDSPCRRSSGGHSSLQQVAAFGVAQRWWRRRGSRVASLASLSRLWWCSVLMCALFACVICVVVVFASVRYVRILLLFIWCGSAPAFYFKKNRCLLGNFSLF